MNKPRKLFIRLMNISPASIARRLHGLTFGRSAKKNDYLTRIPLASVSEVAGSQVVRVDGSYTYFDGAMPWSDLLAFLSVLMDRSPQSVLEIGTYHGHTTRLMALNLPDSEIHTLDLPESYQDQDSGMQKDDWHLIKSRVVGAQYLNDSSINNVVQHFGDSAEYPFPDVELVFIDGAHTYEYVKNDTEKALRVPRVKTLMWHDCDHVHPEVNRWLVEMIQMGYPVRRIDGTHLAILDVKEG